MKLCVLSNFYPKASVQGNLTKGRIDVLFNVGTVGDLDYI